MVTYFDLLNLEDYTTVEYSTKFNKQHNLAVLYPLFLFIFNSCDGTKLFNNILKLFVQIYRELYPICYIIDT